MELSVEKNMISYLDCILCETRTADLSQEVRLSDGMSDAERVIGAWGQPIVRTQEWRSDSILASGGVMAWILYAGEDEVLTTLPVWIPMQLSWDLPPECREGTAAITAVCRFADCRSASPRKLMLRCGVSLQARAYNYAQAEAARIEKQEGVELLERTYPMRLNREVGQKSFPLEEEMSLPEGARLIYCTLNPEVSDCRVLGEKMAFKGGANCHALFLGSEGNLWAEDYPMNFSQFAELDETYGSDGAASVSLSVAAMEAEVGEKGLHVKCSLNANFCISDMEEITVTEDAYAPGADTRVSMQELELPAILEMRTDTMEVSHDLRAEADRVWDVHMQTDFPRRSREGSSTKLQVPITASTVYTDEGGKLQGTTSRWEEEMVLASHESDRFYASARPGQSIQDSLSSEGIGIRSQVSLENEIQTGMGIPMVTEVEVGQKREKGSNPSLILRRAGDSDLWNLAKSCNSTVSSIRSVNHLESEPAPGRMLIIPVCG